VTDPSSRTLLSDPHTEGNFGTVPAQDFHVGVLLYRKTFSPTIVGALPALEKGTWRVGDFTGWRWSGWAEPRSQARLKPVYDSLKMLWRAAPSGEPARPGRRAPSN
jgi:hypothetical protein